MCRMIAGAAAGAVEIGPFLDALACQSRSGIHAPHADGYGLAVLSGGHWIHVREQCPLWEGQYHSLRALRGNVFVLHARQATPGMTINLTKLHPFCWPGSHPGLMFCHNGSIRRAQLLNTPTLDAGAIDTERYFDLVIRHYQSTRNLGAALRQAVEEIQAAHADATSLNAFLTDGQSLVAWKGRVLPENKDYHTLFVHESDELALVSTEVFPLPDNGKWRELEGMVEFPIGAKSLPD